MMESLVEISDTVLRQGMSKKAAEKIYRLDAGILNNTPIDSYSTAPSNFLRQPALEGLFTKMFNIKHDVILDKLNQIGDLGNVL